MSSLFTLDMFFFMCTGSVKQYRVNDFKGNGIVAENAEAICTLH